MVLIFPGTVIFLLYQFVEKFSFRKVIDDWLDDGGELWELIEPVDSLHPTQKAQGKW